MHVVGTIEAAIALGRSFARDRGVNEVEIIGGAEVYRAALPLTDRIYLTLVHAAPAGDTVFDRPDPGTWAETTREAMPKGPSDQFPAEFIVLDRKS